MNLGSSLGVVFLNQNGVAFRVRLARLKVADRRLEVRPKKMKKTVVDGNSSAGNVADPNSRVLVTNLRNSSDKGLPKDKSIKTHFKKKLREFQIGVGPSFSLGPDFVNDGQCFDLGYVGAGLACGASRSGPPFQL